MNPNLAEVVTTALAQFSTASRLYALSVGDGSIDLVQADCWLWSLSATERQRISNGSKRKQEQLNEDKH